MATAILTVAIARWSKDSRRPDVVVANPHADILFSGYHFTNTEALFTLTDPINRRVSGPLKIGASFAGCTLVSFDLNRQTLILRKDRKLRELPFRGSSLIRRPIFFEAPDDRSDHQGQFAFSGIPLKQVAAHFADVSGRKITVAPNIGELKVTGHFRKSSVESFLYVLPQIAPVRIEVGTDNSVQILPKDPGSGPVR